MNDMWIVEPTPPSRHRRRGQILGPCSTMSRPEALAEMAALLQPVMYSREA